MTQTSDFLVVGAGLAGVSVAYELQQRGQSVTVIDSGGVGSRTSATNQGGVRQQFADPTNILAGTRTLQRIAEFETEFGVDPCFRQFGYLFLLESESTVEHYSKAAEAQRALGNSTTFLSPEDVSKRWPDIDSQGLAGATFNPDEGCVDSTAITNGFYKGALCGGVDFRLGEEVISCEMWEGKISRICTSTQVYSAGKIINACGPWAPEFAALYGCELPITARLSPIFLANDGSSNAKRIPMTIDVDQRITVCPNSLGTMIGCSEKVAVNRPGWPPKTDWSLMPAMHAKARRRCSFLAETTVNNAVTGYWEVTPDDHPIIGDVAASNVYTAAGFSGHGISIIPGLARSIAADVLGLTTEIDLSLFRADRFQNGIGKPSELWGSADWGPESDASERATSA